MGIQEIKGVGPQTVKKLNKAGVRTLADLRGMDVEAIAKKTGLDADRLKEWKTEAKMLKVLEDIKGIGPATKKKLQDAGIHSVEDMARAGIHEVAHATNIATERLKAWQSEANKLLKQAEGYVKKEAATVAERTKPVREAAKARGQQATQRSREVATAAAKRSTELAHEVRGRVGELGHRNGNGSTVEGQNRATAEPAPAVETETQVSSNGQVTLLQKIKRIFVKA